MLFIIAAVIGLLGIALLLLDMSRRSKPEPERTTWAAPLEAEPAEDLTVDQQLEDLEVTDLGDQVIETAQANTSEEDVEEYIEGDDLELRHEEPAPPVEEELEPLKLRMIPGSVRRERKAWATHHGFEFAKHDSFLNDEWTRGAASAGAPAKDVISGSVHGHEMYFVEIGGVPVMAMRRAGASDVVVDMRRADLSGEDSDDLIAVTTVEDFSVFANDQGAAERMIDARVRASLKDMPADVTAVWIESDWVLAQTVKNSDHDTWDAITKPLALLTDAARVLPPRTGATQPLDVAELDPSRPLPQPPVLLEMDEEEAEPVIPKIVREEEKTPLPTRAQREAHGVVEPRSVGGDDVDAIADGNSTTPDNYQGTRVIRDNTHKPTIFDN